MGQGLRGVFGARGTGDGVGCRRGRSGVSDTLGSTLPPMATPSTPAAPVSSPTTLHTISFQIVTKETCSAPGCSHTNIAKTCAAKLCASCCCLRDNRCGYGGHDRDRVRWKSGSTQAANQRSSLTGAAGPWTINRPPPIIPHDSNTEGTQPVILKAPMPDAWKRAWDESRGAWEKLMEGEQQRRDNDRAIAHSCTLLFFDKVRACVYSYSKEV